MLDKIVVRYTKDGVVEQNLATGESRLVAQSDYAKEGKLRRPVKEGRYLPPQEQSRDSAKDGEPRPFSARRREKNPSFPEKPGLGNTSGETDTPLFPAAGKNKHAAVHAEAKGRKAENGEFHRENPTAANGMPWGGESRRYEPAGSRGKNPIFFRHGLLSRFGKQLHRSRGDSEKEEDNLGVQTSKEVYFAAGRLRLGVRTGTELVQKHSRREAERSAEVPKRAVGAARRGAQAARAGKPAGKILEHPAAAKFLLAVAAVFLSILFLCTLLGGASGSMLGSATEHPELTAYVRQLDSDFLSRVESAKDGYERKGDDVVLEGSEFVNTDAGSLAILVTRDWTDLSLTQENKKKLAAYHAILNTYTVSTHDETVKDGDKKKVIRHVAIMVQSYTAEEKIDAFGFSPTVRAHILDMLSVLHEIEGENGDASASAGRCTVSAKVLSYQPLVSRYCAQYGISDYVPLVLAVMQQESGGFGTDPLQCSECPDNLKYPNVPNGITDPEYSVQVGIKYLSGCLRAAGCKSPADMPGISLALQGQNYGNGYIPWAKARGGYSPENAKEFSEIEAASHGWSGYGDPLYVPHVMRYYNAAAGNGTFLPPLRSGTYTISRGWGYDGGEFHKGIDFAAPAGTNIYASAAGTVIYARFGSAPYGGYGNVVVIRHDGKLTTLYGHCSKLLVSAGQTVRQGQLIALVGNTGRSEGNHCHFEIRVNGNKVNPEPYLKGVSRK